MRCPPRQPGPEAACLVPEVLQSLKLTQPDYRERQRDGTHANQSPPEKAIFTDESFIQTRQNVSTLFPFIQKVEHFKYINFSLQQNFFQSGPRNCFALQDSRFNNTYAPITAKRAYCKENTEENV